MAIVSGLDVAIFQRSGSEATLPPLSMSVPDSRRGSAYLKIMLETSHGAGVV